MDISQLRNFIAVAEAGSYAKASDLLDIPQPTLSRHVRMLEVEVRASLFHRHGRGVSLTERGKKFIDYARSVVHTVDTALLSVRGADAVYTGNLVIGLTPSIGRALIPALAPRLKAQFPLASIKLTEGLSGSLYDKVLTGQADFAVVFSPASSPNLCIEPLATQRLYLVGQLTETSDNSDISLSELVKLPLILPHSNQWTKPALETAASRLGLSLKVDLEIDSTASTIEIVAGGGGYSIMPGNLQMVATLPPLSWRKIVSPALEPVISIITPTRLARSELAIEAAVSVKEVLAEMR